MNLNFYNPSNGASLENLQMSLQEQIEKLDQLRNLDFNQPRRQQQPPQRYYLDCGNQADWEQFLNINYGITEAQIFEDYRLFLQAKAELSQSQDKERLEEMKKKISLPNERRNNEQSHLQSAGVKQQPIQSFSSYEQPLRGQSLVQSQPTMGQSNFINANAGKIEQNKINGTADTNIAPTSNFTNKLEENTNHNSYKGGKHVR